MTEVDRLHWPLSTNVKSLSVLTPKALAEHEITCLLQHQVNSVTTRSLVKAGSIVLMQLARIANQKNWVIKLALCYSTREFYSPSVTA